MGTWSFSLYLWQQPFYMLYRHEGLPAPLALACALALGVSAFHLIENPARNWLNGMPAKKAALPPEKDDVSMLQP
jgi:peptidoglycan/LPS O-acetylase OafA/YrhL